MNLHQQALHCNINILNTAVGAKNNIESDTGLKMQIPGAAGNQSKINNILVSGDNQLQNACIAFPVLNTCKHSSKKTQKIDFDDFLSIAPERPRDRVRLYIKCINSVDCRLVNITFFISTQILCKFTAQLDFYQRLVIDKNFVLPATKRVTQKWRK